ncbi:MAG: hypothetical protein LBD13_06320 [Spirochaetaceae bacterium]|jgi:hypothetical protein|nr:hypothetical protein [Spirochaetaceae bacterium]
MGKQKDWFPRVRALVLIMARVWENALAFKGGSWGIPNTVITALHDLITAAQDALDLASPALRTPVLTARVNAAFAALEAHMREIKDRYFKQPPLLDEDLVSLLLKPRDTVMTPAARPESHVLLVLRYEGYNTVVVDINLMPGDRPAEGCHVELFRGVMPHAGATLEEAAGAKHYLMAPPSSGEGLFKWLDTNRKRERASFPPEEGGKVGYFCARYVNSKGEQGPWGPVAAIIIPRADNPLGAGAGP